MGMRCSHCWTGASIAACGADGTTMQTAIADMVAGDGDGSKAIVANTVTAPTVFSKALKLTDGVVASGGNRFEDVGVSLGSAEMETEDPVAGR